MELANKDPDKWIFDRRVGNQFIFHSNLDYNDQLFLTPRFIEGDVIWIREAFGKTAIGTMYKASVCFPDVDKPISGWKPSIHMPKEAARIFLKVSDVRCERLHDISNEDAIAEGVQEGFVCNPDDRENTKMKVFRIGDGENYMTAVDAFKHLWQKINGLESWKSNPWVWVYTFEITEKPDNFLTTK